MATYVTREEFEARMRVVEGEVEGEKAVTRHILEQTRHNSNDLTTLKGDMALAKAALTSQSALLTVLVQDVREIRTEMRARFDALTEDIAVIRAAVAPRRPPPGA